MSIAAAILLAACSTSPSPQAPHAATVDNAHLSATSLSLLRSIDISVAHDQPSQLESNESLRTKLPLEARALIISEAFYPTRDINGSNDQNRRTIRSAHFAYEGLSSQRCRESQDQICEALAIQYSRAVRFIAEDLVRNHWDTAHLSGNGYDITLNGDGGSVDINDWEIRLSDRESALQPGKEGAHAFGAQAAACKTSPTANDAPLFTTCSPIELVMTFEAPTEAAYARAFVTAVDTRSNDRVRIGAAEFPLTESPSTAWDSLSSIVFKGAETGTPSQARLACFGEVDPKRITVLFMPDSNHASAPWVEITSALSTDPEIADRYNFCLYSDHASDISAKVLDDLTTSITLHLSSPRTLLSTTSAPRIVFITQGSHSGDLVSAIKLATRKSGRDGAANQFETAGLFAISPHLFPDTAPVDAANSSVSDASLILVAQKDIKRLLTKVAEQHEEEDLENNLPDEIDLSVSPIM
jgi:hypothetical protein